MIKYALAGLTGIILLPVLILVAVLSDPPPGVTSGASAAALADIPPDLLPVYQQAAATCPGLDWAVLAAIGKIETDHGRDPGAGVHSGENYAGAGGPMQFLSPTWPAYGVDGNSDGIADRYNPVDAIYGAAHYLCANGAGDPNRTGQAIFAYNHATWYVTKVLDQAALYRSPAGVAGGRPAPDGPTMAVEGPDGPITLIRVPPLNWVNTTIAGDVAALLAAADTAGVHLGGGAWRSTDSQIALRQAHCGTSQYDVYDKPASQCSPPTARPGQSMHERGLAIDFTCNSAGTISSHSGPCWDWLNTNAATYGLRNLASESWHWSPGGN